MLYVPRFFSNFFFSNIHNKKKVRNFGMRRGPLSDHVRIG